MIPYGCGWSVVSPRILEFGRLLMVLVGAFDIEVIRAIVATKALDSPDYRHRYHGDRLYSEYLLARTMVDHGRKYHLSGAVQDTADYILHELGEVRVGEHVSGEHNSRKHDILPTLPTAMPHYSWDIVLAA